MKNKYYIFVALLATTITGIVPTMAQKSGPVTDTIYLGPGYANELYYNMSTGNQGAVDRKQWDIAFRTSRMSASILTNDGANNNAISLAGVELYTYPKSDSSGWATFDTTGLYSWKKLVNSTSDWETGAFNQNQLGHPDYGWGKYNTSSHDVMGDSLYLIKLRDGSIRKLFIRRKYSSLNLIEFRYAKLDGSSDTTMMVDCNPYSGKNFVGYSITTNQIVDFEPVASINWDILFTRYIYTYPDGVTTYPVVGTLSNYKTKVNVFKKVSPDFRIFDVESMDSTRSPIGWEWKYLDTEFIFHVEDSLVHFIQDRAGNIHKLVFKDYSGSSTGRIVLEKEMISAAGINKFDKSGFNATIYPNPVTDRMNLVINPEKGNSVEVTLLDMAGRTAFNSSFDLPSNVLSTLQIPVSDIPSGVYIVKIQVGNKIMSRKVIINN